MSNKSKAIGAASVLAAGVGAAAYLTAKKKQGDKAVDSKKASSNNGYRNTELGKYEKNSKGIYYSNGNYEAFEMCIRDSTRSISFSLSRSASLTISRSSS